jgi:MFS family permease
MQKEWHFDAASTYKISCVGILALNIGCVIAGRIADRAGAWRTFAAYSMLIALAVTLMSFALSLGTSAVLMAYVLPGLCSGTIVAFPAIMVRLFPSEVKVTGISLIYYITYSVCFSIIPLSILTLYHSAHGVAQFVVGTGLLTFITCRNGQYTNKKERLPYEKMRLRVASRRHGTAKNS